MATESFGRWLKRRRSGLGLTQAGLADRVAYAEETIQKVETDKLRPSRQLATKLAEALELPVEQRAAFIRFARDEGELPELPTQSAASIPAPTAVVGTPSRQGPPSGTVTFLFTDIEGSTRLWERQPEAMQLALAQHDRLVRQAVDGHGGYIFKTVGDAFCVAFETAHEALVAALEAQRGLQPPPRPPVYGGERGAEVWWRAEGGRGGGRGVRFAPCPHGAA